MKKFVGVDGCKAGWFCAWQTRSELRGAVYSSMQELWNDHQDAERILIDIPIGLRRDSPRLLESKVRGLLGPRRSSVFPVPCFDATYAPDYIQANQQNRKMIGKGLSKQAWFITDKIREVDTFLREMPAAIPLLGECHPELAFATFNGDPLANNKKTSEGKAERLTILKSCFDNQNVDIEHALRKWTKAYPKIHLVEDDCFDAAVLLVTARAAKVLERPPESGEANIPIQMWVPDTPSYY